MVRRALTLVAVLFSILLAVRAVVGLGLLAAMGFPPTLALDANWGPSLAGAIAATLASASPTSKVGRWLSAFFAAAVAAILVALVRRPVDPSNPEAIVLSVAPWLIAAAVGAFAARGARPATLGNTPRPAAAGADRTAEADR
jgi:hypothetical protein